jgi:polyhydroxyalkanoate synthase
MASSAPSDLLARVRRDVERSILRSRNGLKLLSGVGRPQVGSSPKHVVWKSGKVELWRYRSRSRTLRPPLLLVHSLVTRNYVFDLAPGNSFVEALLARGFDLYLIDWGAPDELEAGYTLETYCDGFLPDMVDEIRLASRSDTVAMFGYCFGGLLALLYAAGHASGPVTSLAVMATPVDFRPLGALTSVFRVGSANPEDLLDATGNVPAEAIRSSFKMIQPTGSITNYVNLWEHLWNSDYVDAHQIMTMWANDHIAFAGACMTQVATLFARDNLLATGRVPLGSRTIDLADITIPFLSIVGEHDHIVPPASTGDLTALVGAADAENLCLPAGHVGLIVGRSAHAKYIPAMADWIERHSTRV